MGGEENGIGDFIYGVQHASTSLFLFSESLPLAGSRKYSRERATIIIIVV